MQCNLQIAPLSGQPGHMIMLISPRELAGRMVQNSSVKAAAKSAIGMAEMLAHEIKNPLAGITGAAQLLSMNVGSGDLELTDLIVSESRRIVACWSGSSSSATSPRPICARSTCMTCWTARALGDAGISPRT